MNGFINLIKPEGMSSAYAVGLIKSKFRLKAGHMGTLDPMASGVLPIGINHASRLFPYMLSKNKTYIAEFKFGLLTDTLDITGSIEKTCDYIPKKEEIENALKDFTGEFLQEPPRYSAKCVNGKRGYELARKGLSFSLEPKLVNVTSIKLLEKVNEDTFKFEIKCLGGTYVRSIARDLGYKTNSLAVMSKLLRSECGTFSISNGVTVEEIKNAENLESLLIPSDSVVNFEKLILTKEQAKKIIDGVYENYGFKDGIYRVYNESEFLGVGTSKDGLIRINAYVR